MQTFNGGYLLIQEILLVCVWRNESFHKGCFFHIIKYQTNDISVVKHAITILQKKILVILRPGRCPEIPEILKFVLKCPEIGVRS